MGAYAPESTVTHSILFVIEEGRVVRDYQLPCTKWKNSITSLYELTHAYDVQLYHANFMGTTYSVVRGGCIVSSSCGLSSTFMSSKISASLL